MSKPMHPVAKVSRLLNNVIDRRDFGQLKFIFILAKLL